MRATIFTLLIAFCLTTGCDDPDATDDTLPGPSSGSTVSPPPPVTSTPEPTTRPASETTSDLREEHRQNYDVTPTPGTIP